MGVPDNDRSSSRKKQQSKAAPEPRLARTTDSDARPRGRPRKGETRIATIYRMQIRLSEKGFERVQKIQDQTEANSHADVVRDALRLYDEVLEAIAEGYELRIVDPNNLRAPGRPLRNLRP